QYAQAQELLDHCPRSQREWEWRYLHYNNRVRLLDLEGAAPPAALAFGLNGRWVVAASARDVRVWDGAGQVLATLAEARAPLAVSPDGKLLACAGMKGGVRLWALQAEKLKKVANRPMLGEADLSAQALAFAPDGKSLAALGADGVARIYAIG